MTGELESVTSLQVLKGRVIFEIQIGIRNCRSGVSKVVSCSYLTWKKSLNVSSIGGITVG